MITRQYIKEFHDNGFVVVRKFLRKKDINNMLSQMDDVLSTILKYNKIKYSKKLSVDDKYFLLKKKKPILKAHVWDSIKILDSFNNLVFSEKILRLVKKILNEKTIFVTNYRLLTDHKQEPRHLGCLHQELNKISSESALVWCPLVKVNKKLGGLCVIPGSHKYGHLFFKESKIPPNNRTVGVIGNILKDQEKINYRNKIVQKFFDKKNLYFPNLNPGDAVIHNMFTFHAATNHVGKGIRWTLSSNYHRISKTPYILHENFKSDKNKNFKNFLI